MQIPPGGRITYLHEYILLGTLWQWRSLEQSQLIRGIAMKGKPGNGCGRPTVITGPRIAESLRAEKLVVSVRFHSQNYEKPQKQMCVNNSRTVPSESTFRVFIQKKFVTGTQTAPPLPLNYCSSALECLGANTYTAAPLFSENKNVD